MAAIDSREALRFIFSGGISTACNLAAVAGARLFTGFGVALLFGMLAGVISSFLLTKIFAFRAHEWQRAGGEAVRFLLVYGFGLALYYVIALIAREELVGAGVDNALAEISGVLAGAGAMTVTGYFGHRFFTYRTAREDHN